MIPLGLWIGIVGYGILYAGVVKLGGGKCSLGDAFRGQCAPASSSSQNSNTTPASGFSSTAGAGLAGSSSAIPASNSPGGGSW